MSKTSMACIAAILACTPFWLVPLEDQAPAGVPPPVQAVSSQPIAVDMEAARHAGGPLRASADEEGDAKSP